MSLRKTTTRLILHHSASPRATSLEMLRAWHKERGFSDIGYHFVIDGHGTLLRGRDIHVVGAHALGANHDSIGICITGNNTDTGSRWTPVQIATLREHVERLQLVFGPLIVCGHRDAVGGHTATECPGLNVQDVL